ncbi:MAG TPA: hypothetical protein PKD54_11560 [Pirellulaceae bacterium]|nr:hypothetical protein [Pirellulaceae bacterium]
MSAWTKSLTMVGVSMAAVCLPAIFGRTTTGADEIIGSDFTQSGGTLTVNPAGALIVTHASNNPLLTLTNGSGTSGVQAMIVGNLMGHSGRLLVNQGSVLTNSGNGSVLGTYGSVSVVRGDGYVGLNGGSSGIATITGAGSHWFNSRELHVGRDGHGEMNVLSGGRVTNQSHGYVGRSAGSNGTVVVRGDGSEWHNTGSLFIGWQGSGELRIEEGGYVVNDYGRVGQFAGSSGSLTVTGAGSHFHNNSFLTVADFGSGYLRIEDGGIVSSVGSAELAARSNSYGEALVRGQGSQWNSGNWLTIAGNNATGHLRIEDGGVVTSTVGIVGSANSSNLTGAGYATITGPGSQWINSNTFIVGRFAKGDLTIEHGGLVTSVGGGIGLNNAAGTFDNIVRVMGTDSRWLNSGNLDVGGFNSSATLNILAGGLVENEYANVTGQAGTFATVQVSGTGSRWLNHGGLSINGNGSAHVFGGGEVAVTEYVYLSNGGKLALGADGMVRTHDLDHLDGSCEFSGGHLVLTGTAYGGFDVPEPGKLSGTGSVWGNLLNQGILSPGLSVGTFSISGDYEQSATGSLRIELGGLLAGSQFDQLTVSGTASLDGFLDVTLISGFVPDPSDSFTILTASLVSGVFANAPSEILLAGGKFQVLYTSDAVILGNFQSIPEPSSLVLMWCGLMACIRYRSRVRRSAS